MTICSVGGGVTSVISVGGRVLVYGAGDGKGVSSVVTGEGVGSGVVQMST